MRSPFCLVVSTSKSARGWSLPSWLPPPLGGNSLPRCAVACAMLRRVKDYAPA
nr:MAG TPA: hypothetical protein [Caudoviricetes sp.]DAT14213.1 MAG TPA: hypothetical protein [Caudoviricetes sp.]